MQSISPEIIYRGNGAWEKALPQIVQITKSPLILGKDSSQACFPLNKVSGEIDCILTTNN